MQWSEIVALEPRLQQAEDSVRSLDAQAPGYSETQAYANMKVQVERLVGWHREGTADQITPGNERLKSLYGSDAYDVAMKHLYDLIPMEPVHEEMDE